jgi:hypothetical protein
MDKIAVEGVFPNKTVPCRSAPIVRATTGETVLLVPRMWSENMLSSQRIRQSIGADYLTVNSSDAQKMGLRDGFNLELEVNGNSRAVTVRIDDAVSAPTLPALNGDLSGALSSVKIAVAAGGDD